MGNCATCCGKQDNNEIITEKQNKLRGVSNENNYAASNDYTANGYLPGGKKGKQSIPMSHKLCYNLNG